jgi:hypothetical protein
VKSYYYELCWFDCLENDMKIPLIEEDNAPDTNVKEIQALPLQKNKRKLRRSYSIQMPNY